MIAQIISAEASGQRAFFVANGVDRQMLSAAVKQTLPRVTRVDVLSGTPGAELLRGVAPGTLRIWKGEERFEAL